MLKMGRMCHCTRPVTIIQWSPDGTVLWKRNRGTPQSGNRYDNLLLVDGTSHVYVGGSLVSGQNHGGLLDYDPTDVAWYSDRNGLTEVAASTPTANYNSPMLIKASDGALWRDDGGRMHRYDSSGVMQSSTTGIENDGWIAGPSGTAFGFLRRLGTLFTSRIERYSTGLSSTHAYFTGGLGGSGTVYEVLDIGGSQLAILGYVFRSSPSTSAHVVIVDQTLAYVDGLIASGGSDVYGRAVAAGTTIFAFEHVPSTATFRFRKYDCSVSPPTNPWENTTMQSSGSGYSPCSSSYDGLLATDGTDFYCVSKKSASDPFKVQKRDGTNGDILWEVDVGVSFPLGGLKGLAVGGGVVAVVGRWYNGAASTDPRSVIALDADDGTELFHKMHSTSFASATDGLHGVYVDSSGNVYATGGEANQ